MAADCFNSTFRALADETRREILRSLRDRPRTSGDIAAQFASSWPTISRHLAVLREARLVLAERKGQEIYYELNTTVFQDVVQHLLDWVRPEVRTSNATPRTRMVRQKQQEAL